MPARSRRADQRSPRCAPRPSGARRAARGRSTAATSAMQRAVLRARPPRSCGQLAAVGQLAVPQQVGDGLERLRRRELLHGVAAVQQAVRLGVDLRDRRVSTTTPARPFLMSGSVMSVLLASGPKVEDAGVEMVVRLVVDQVVEIGAVLHLAELRGEMPLGVRAYRAHGPPRPSRCAAATPAR